MIPWLNVQGQLITKRDSGFFLMSTVRKCPSMQWWVLYPKCKQALPGLGHKINSLGMTWQKPTCYVDNTYVWLCLPGLVFLLKMKLFIFRISSKTNFHSYPTTILCGTNESRYRGRKEHTHVNPPKSYTLQVHKFILFK